MIWIAVEMSVKMDNAWWYAGTTTTALEENDASMEYVVNHVQVTANAMRVRLVLAVVV